jgi:hypothetical protein
MFLCSGIGWLHRAGSDHIDGCYPRFEKGSIMPVLIVAIAAILGFGLFRYMRTRSAH